MAQLTYLQLTNRVLQRITQPEVSTVIGITGQGKLIAEFINQAQNELWTETTNWYTLFKQRNFKTVLYTAATIAFNNAAPATITDSANGFGNFQSGMTILVNGTTGAVNDGTYVVTTAAVGTLTLQTADSLTAQIAGPNVTIYALSYAVASDFGRAYHLVDYTNNRILTEDVLRAFSEDDPLMTATNNPTHYCMQGNFYRMYFIPSGVFTMIDRYWSVPTTLVNDADLYSLPLFCENFIIEWSYMKILEYMNKYDTADRVRASLYGNPTKPSIKGILEKCLMANKKVMDTMIRFGPHYGASPVSAPRFPSHYDSRYS